MMLGREVHQVTDLSYRDLDTFRETLDCPTYLNRLRHALEMAHAVARTYLQQAQRKQKHLYDMRVRERQYETGDLV